MTSQVWAAEDPEGPHALRIHLQVLDFYGNHVDLIGGNEPRVGFPAGKPRAWISYFNPITIESGPTSGSTRVFENPTSRIQA